MICFLSLILLVIIIANCFQLGSHFIEHVGKPGPWWTIPVVGHLPCLGLHLSKGLLRWKKIYGPLFFVRFGTIRTLILSDAAVIEEAFTNPSLCGRQQLGYFLEATHSKGFFIGDGPAAFDHRNFITSAFKDFGIHRMNIGDMIQEDIAELLQRIDAAIDTNYSIHTTFNKPVINSLWSCLMGKKYIGSDANLQELVRAVHRMMVIPNVFAVLGIYVPIISTLLPKLSGFTSGLDAYRNLHATISSQINQQKKSQIGDQPQNVCEAYLEQIERVKDTQSSSDWNETTMIVTFSDLFIAALDTTSSTLEWSIALLSRNAEIQRKLQNEISTVIGDSGSPSIEDAAKMPYCEEVIYEIHRFSSVVPLGIPHRAIENTTLRGYTVPKDTLVVPNLYSLFHDPQVWGDPEVFRPERFIQLDGKFKKPSDLIPFSCGKRACLGEQIGSCQEFLFLTNILQKYHVTWNGDLKEQSLEGAFGYILKPLPFHVVFSKRVKGHQ